MIARVKYLESRKRSTPTLSSSPLLSLVLASTISHVFPRWLLNPLFPRSL